MNGRYGLLAVALAVFFLITIVPGAEADGTCTVQFLNYDGTVLDVQHVQYGGSAVAPQIPDNGLTFTGWDRDYTYITSDIIINATYSDAPVEPSASVVNNNKEKTQEQGTTVTYSWSDFFTNSTSGNVSVSKDKPTGSNSVVTMDGITVTYVNGQSVTITLSGSSSIIGDRYVVHTYLNGRSYVYEYGTLHVTQHIEERSSRIELIKNTDYSGDNIVDVVQCWDFPRPPVSVLDLPDGMTYTVHADEAEPNYYWISLTGTPSTAKTYVAVFQYYSGYDSYLTKETVTIVVNEGTVTYSVSFNLDGGSGGPSAFTVKAPSGGTQISFTNVQPTKSEATFNGWKYNGSVLSNNSTVSFYATTTSITLTATWTYSYRVEFNANSGYGAPSGENVTSNTNNGFSYQLPNTKPSINSSYTFKGWSLTQYSLGQGLNSTLIQPGTTKQFSANPGSTVTLYAVWAPYPVVTIYPNTINEPSYSYTTMVAPNTTYTPNEPSTPYGYQFKGWKVNNSGSAVQSYTVTKDVSLYAYFTEKSKHTITASTSDSTKGSVDTSLNGQQYDGNSYQISAYPKEGYVFSMWKDGSGNELSTSNPYVIQSLSSNVTIVAYFEVNNKQYGITVSVHTNDDGTTGGTIQSSHQVSMYNGQVTINCYPDVGYLFDYLLDVKSGRHISESSYTFTVKGESEFIAYFSKIPVPTFEIRIVSEGNGKVSFTGSDASTDAVKTVNKDTDLEINATADSGNHFVNWTDANGRQYNDSTLNLTKIAADMTYTAHFAENTPDTVTIEVGTDFGGMALRQGMVGGELIDLTTPSGTLIKGGTAYVKAVPDEHYAFVNWTVNGQTVSEDASYSFTIDENTVITAHFVKTEYLVTFQYEDGTVIYTEYVTYLGSVKDLPSDPAPIVSGTIFSTWDGNWETITSDTVITAVFIEEDHEITYIRIVWLDTDGNTLRSQRIQSGIQVPSIQLPSSSGGIYIGWFSDIQCTELYDYTVIPASDVTLYAKFVANSQPAESDSSGDSDSKETVPMPIITSVIIGFFGLVLSGILFRLGGWRFAAIDIILTAGAVVLILFKGGML